MMTTILVTGAKLTSAGFCMGIGFWGAKMLTNKLEETLVLYDSRKIERLAKEMNLSPV